MSDNKNFNPTGALEIWKYFPDGTKEQIFSDRNVICSGLGAGLAYLHSGQGSNDIRDYQIVYFQLGTGGVYENVGHQLEYDETQFKLNTPIAYRGDYGSLSEKSADPPTTFMDVSELNISTQTGTTAKQPIARIRHSNIHRVNKNAVRYTIALMERNCNNLELNEIGIFMKNPTGDDEDRPKLAAYRQFPKIKKTKSFTLVFLWTLQF